jgi:hypothetical protein
MSNIPPPSQEPQNDKDGTETVYGLDHDRSDTFSQGRAQRPLGITLLMVLHLIMGLVLVGTQAWALSNPEEITQRLNAAGIPYLLVLAGATIISVTALASGVGMVMGARWGWWFTAFYYVYSIVRNLGALVTVHGMTQQLESEGTDPTKFYGKYLSRAAISTLILLYLYRANVLRFFRLESMNKFGAFLYLLGICGSISAISYWINLLAH